MKQKKRLTALILAAALTVSGMCLSASQPDMMATAANDMIQNDSFWKDTSGNNIYSQGGGIFQFGDTYYWYGVHYGGADTYAANPSKKNEDTSFKSVTCYSSKDLVNWKFENDVLTPKSKGFGWAYWVGRMGVCYNKNTKKYVLITQYNDSVLFASCDTPTGNFVVENVQDQIPGVLKQGTGDQTVFIDDDGTPYLVCSNKGGRGHQYIVPLRASDYLAAEQAKEVAKGSGREGNCLFKYKGRYYFCASDLHGWNASHSYYMSADNIMGPYTGWAVMDGTDEDFSYVTQTGFFYTVKGSKQETVLYCGDRWSDFAGNGIGYNQWVPLTVNGTKVKFNSLSQWHLNAQTGEWAVGAGNNYILNPSFDADRVSQEKLAGWTNSGTGNANANGAKTGRWCAQQYSASAFKGTMSQKVTLPNGTYTLKAWAKSSGGQNASYIYVKNYGGADKTVSIKDIGGDWKEVTIPDITVTNGSCEVGIYSDGKAGNWVKVDDFSLIGNGSGTVTPFEPYKIPDGKLMQNITVNDTANETAWSLHSGMKPGDPVFGDRTFRFTAVPESLQDAEVLQTACNSKKYTEQEASFQAAADIMVYVGVDERVTDLPWLSDWTKTAETLVDDGDPVVTYRVFKKACQQGETVTIGTLGVSNAVNYLVMAKPLAEDTTLEEQTIPVLVGDMNGDNKLNATDLSLLKQKLITGMTDAERLTADVNGDGTADTADAALLRDYLLGHIKSFS